MMVNSNTFRKVVENLKSKIDIYFLILIVIIGVGVFFRFYNTPERYSLGVDSCRDAMVAFIAAENIQLPLTGPFSSAGQFTFGPWFYYLMIVFTILTPFENAPWMVMGVSSVFFIFLMYKIGEALFDKKFGLIAASLAAISSNAIFTGTMLHPHYLIPSFTALTLWLFIIILKKKTAYWTSFFLGLSLGIGINTHYQMLGIIWIIPLLLLFKSHQRVKHTAWALVGFFVTCIPLGLFDLMNNWFTLRHLSDYYFNSEGRIYIPTRWLFYLRDFWPTLMGDIFGLSKIWGYILLLACVCGFLWILYKRKINRAIFALSILFLINFISLRFYWGERFLGYLQFLVPLIFLVLALFFWSLAKKKIFYIGLLFLIVALSFMFPPSLQRLETYTDDRYLRREAELISKQAKSKVVIYNCKDYLWERSQAITLLLRMNGKTSSTGQKIGYINPNCTYPVPGFDPKVDATPSAAIINSHFPKLTSVEAVDFSSASEEALRQFGWKPVISENIYDSTVKWWYEEKP